MTNKKKFEINPNAYKSLELKSIKIVFMTIILAFLLLIISLIFLSNFIIIAKLVFDINNQYIYSYLTEPFSNLNENVTKAIDIRIITQQNIMLESKMQNMKIFTEFINNKKLTLPKVVKEKSKFIQSTSNKAFDIDIDAYFTNMKYMLNQLNKNSLQSIKPKEIIVYTKSNNGYWKYITLYDNINRNPSYIHYDTDMTKSPFNCSKTFCDIIYIFVF